MNNNHFFSSFSFTYAAAAEGSFLMKKESTPAKHAVMQNRIIGTGGLTSAINGANIVVVFAPILQIPKAVPAKIAGKIYALAK